MSQSPTATGAPFAGLADQFLKEEYDTSPVWASALGHQQYDEALDDLSARAIGEHADRGRAWLARFEASAGAEPLGLEDDVDRQLIISVLRGRSVMEDWEMWRRQPDTYLNPGLHGVFSLFLHRLKPEPELVQAAVARLRQLPRNLDDGKKNLRPDMAPRIYVERARNQALAGARYARELLPAEVRDEHLRATLAEAGAVAGEALEAFAGYLDGLMPAAEGAWAIGEERYSRLLAEKEMLSLDAAGLRERGRQEYERLAEELRRCSRTIASTDDWAATLLTLNEDCPATPEAMRAAYEEWTQRARRFLQERGLVSFPEGEECAVEPSPPFQRPVLGVASYQMPPAFSASMTGHFFVPFPPDGASPDDVRKRLEGNSYPSIPTTAVHEAYPGHHWQLVMAKRHPSPVRRSYRTAYFSEGWALYTERMMREQGFFEDPKQEMSQYEATIFRAARIVVDTSLHSGEMTYDEAVQFMMQRANLTEPVARAEVTRYCAWPTQASSYLTGCLEILRIRERYFQARGKPLADVDTLRSFHDTLATSGGLPIALAERIALEK